MNNPEVLYLIGKLRQEYLLQEAEKRRLANAARRKKPHGQGVVLIITKWFRKRLVVNNETPFPASEKQTKSNVCCPETNSLTGI